MSSDTTKTVPALLQPPYVLTADKLEKTPNVWAEGWQPRKPLRWLLSDIRIAQPQAHDLADDLIDDCLLQYQVNNLESLIVHRLSLQEWLWSAAKHELNLPLGSVIRAKSKFPDLPLQPDNPANTLWACIESQAIYHHDFVAIPYRWGAARDQIFTSQTQALQDRVVEQLIFSHTLAELRAGTVMFSRLRDVTSPFCTYYATPYHAVWCVSRDTFYVPPLARKTLPPSDTVRSPQSEKLREFEIDPIYRVHVGFTRRPHAKKNRPPAYLANKIHYEMEFLPSDYEASE